MTGFSSFERFSTLLDGASKSVRGVILVSCGPEALVAEGKQDISTATQVKNKKEETSYEEPQARSQLGPGFRYAAWHDGHGRVRC